MNQALPSPLFEAIDGTESETSCTDVSSKLVDIFQKAAASTSPLSESAVRDLLKGLSGHATFLSRFESFSNESYCRNRIFASEHLELLVLCWRPGQRTPIHNHAGSRCGVYVIRGVASEIGFRPSPDGNLIRGNTQNLYAGSITTSYDTDTHLVGNFSPCATDLVTLHCYSPPLTEMRVFEGEEESSQGSLHLAYPAVPRGGSQSRT